ncbi:MAG: hypothetical protein LBF84_00985 [Holosporales bacterium]|jgi:hypothetical protein|nr:hypothetical protein [Holosporales bacterium]
MKKIFLGIALAVGSVFLGAPNVSATMRQVQTRLETDWSVPHRRAVAVSRGLDAAKRLIESTRDTLGAKEEGVHTDCELGSMIRRELVPCIIDRLVYQSLESLCFSYYNAQIACGFVNLQKAFTHTLVDKESVRASYQQVVAGLQGWPRFFRSARMTCRLLTDCIVPRGVAIVPRVQETDVDVQGITEALAPWDALFWEYVAPEADETPNGDAEGDVEIEVD